MATKCGYQNRVSVDTIDMPCILKNILLFDITPSLIRPRVYYYCRPIERLKCGPIKHMLHTISISPDTI